MIDDDQSESSQPAMAGHFQQGYGDPGMMQDLSENQRLQANTGQQMFGYVSQLPESYDSMLDADPFGLSQSMHFPTQFNFESNTR